MLDAFEIITTSGVVLWSKHYAPIGPNIINSLIRDVFIEERAALGSKSSGDDSSAASNPAYKKEKYTLKWTTAKDLGLIFVAVYQSLIHLSWIDKLLDNVRTIFTGLYRDEFKKPYTSVIDCPFDAYFDRQISELEKTAGAANGTATSPIPRTEITAAPTADKTEEDIAPPPMPGVRPALSRGVTEDNATSAEATPVTSPNASRPGTPSSQVLTAKAGPGGKLSRRGKKNANTSNNQAREAASSRLTDGKTPTTKKGRKWDDNGMLDEADDAVLDYSTATSSDPLPSSATTSVPEELSSGAWSKKTASGETVLRDLDEEMSSILSAEASRKAKLASTAAPTDGLAGTLNSGLSSISSMFSSIIGGKTLTDSDLAKPLKSMEDHLINRNVARSAAVQLCASVHRDLLGTTAPSLTSLDNVIRGAVSSALSRMLTPTSTLDILRSIQARQTANAALAASSSSSTTPRRPYVISIVGVNGVGKSTTLAKLAFLLLHNDLRVLVAAADTFRSGAVEQLRVHVRNLQTLTQREAIGHIDLYERGYGKDAAHVARDAVAFASSAAASDGAADKPYDVVLIDTAGRRHNDTRLMSSLAPFAKLANPDKILMVGEALVGTDSVAQAQHFNEAFGAGRQLDGFIVSKCDTVGEMVGTLVSLVAATGVPIVAVGVGQHYGDLRGFNVTWARDLLLS